MEDNDYLILKEKLKLHLSDFIQENHPDQSKVSSTGKDLNFRCLGGTHADNNPSMFIGHKIPQVAKCRSCGANMSIFHMHNKILKAPMYGRDFIDKNLNVLALKYGYTPIEIAALSEDALHRMKLYDIHEAAFELLKSGENSSGIVSRQFNKAMGITDEVADEMGIGTVTDYQKFTLTIMRIGNWSEEDLKDAGFKPALFGPTILTYTVHNSTGRAVAFAGRDWQFDGRFSVPISKTYVDGRGITKDRQKWNNSTTSLIYEKINTLYGYHKAKRYSGDAKVYVVEGYADAAVLWSHGIDNVVCVGSTAFSAKHIQMLKEADKSIVVIALDNDLAGWKATDTVLEEGFKNIPFIKAQVLLVPPTMVYEGKLDTDPDAFVKAHGKDAFLNLRPLTAFEYTITRIPDSFDSDAEKDLFVQRFIPIIMNETSAITQQTMRKAIASKIGVPESLIREYQHNLQYVTNSERRERLKREHKMFIRKFEDSLNFNPEEAVSIVSKFRDSVNNELNSDYVVKMGVQEVIDGFSAWREERETAEGKDLFWKTGMLFIDNQIGGIQKSDNFVAVAGPSNHGKSCLLTNLCLGLLENNDLREMMLLYWTIDDTKETLYTKLVAIKARATIFEVFTYKDQPHEKKSRITKAMNFYEKCIRNQNLIVKGTNIGKTGEDVKKWVETMQERHPEKRVILMIDNFSNMKGPGEELAAQMHNIEILHDLRCGANLAIISTFEMNKEGFDGRGTTTNLKGTGAILYRVTRTIKVYNDHKSNEMKGSTNPEYFWYNQDGAKRPVLELSLGKSKNMGPTNVGGNLYMQFEPNIGSLFEIGDDARFAEYKTENNIKRRYTDVGLSGWISNVSKPEAVASKFVEAIEEDTTDKSLTMEKLDQDTSPPNLLGASTFDPELAYLDEGL